jgi:type I restriction enzyme S subunit
MEKYDTYKDSGIEWIGAIPAHWEVKRFKYFFKIITQKSTRELKKIGLENIKSKTGKFIDSNTDFEGQGVHFKKRDILFGKLRPYLAKVWLAHFEGLAVGDFYVFRTISGVIPEFAKYRLIDYAFIDITNSSTFGSKMPRVSWEFIANLLIAFPKPEEQSKIANYLDKKTAEIDDLIAQKKKLLKLYKKEKEVIINQAVTKGINPNVKLKNSGIEWLGDIPEHWEVKRLKYVLESQNTKRVPLSSSVRGEMMIKEYDYYGASGVIDKVDDYIFNEPLILIGEDGANLLTRSKRLVFIAKGKYWVNNHAHILKPKYGLMYYYSELLELYDFSIWVTGSAQPKLTSENLLNIPMIVPPIEEQKEIAEFLDKYISEIESKSTKTKKLIALLTEYKTALISEVVTGKIKIN